MPVIQSLLDTDLYKFTMMQAVLHQHPAAHAEYRFRCRTPGVDLARHIDAIADEIDHLCTLRLAEEELDYLRGLRFIKSDFVDFLALFRLQRKYVSLRRSDAEPGAIELEVKGPWLHTILFEVPLLAIVNEVYFRDTHGAPDEAEGLRRLEAKLARINDAVGYEDCRITDFGTRRRYSRAWHDRLIPRLVQGLGEKFAAPATSTWRAATAWSRRARWRTNGCRPTGAGAAAARFRRWPRSRLGPRVPRRPRHRAHRRDRPGRVRARLRHVLLQAVRRHAPRLRRPGGVGRLIAPGGANKVDPRTKVFVFSDGLDIEVMRLYAHFRGVA